MPLIKTFLCSGICFLYVIALAAQSVLKNKTLTNVVGYQVHQQKLWSYNQLPKNSIQYRSDPKYIPLRDNKVSMAGLQLSPVTTPEIKRSFSVSSSSLHIRPKSYLQGSRFLKYQWQKQNHLQTVQKDSESGY